MSASMVEQFRTIVESGIGTIQPAAYLILSSLAVVELVMLGFKGMAGTPITMDAIKWLIKYCLFIYMVGHWYELTTDVFNFAKGIASKAAGSSEGEAIFDDPTKIFTFYKQKVLKVFLEKINNTSFWDFITNGSSEILSALIAVCILLVLSVSLFFVMSEILTTIIAFYLVSLFAVVVMPFYFNEHTKHLAENAFTSIFRGAFRIGMNIFGLTIVWKMIETQITISEGTQVEPYYLASVAFSLAVVVFVFKGAVKYASNALFRFA